MTDLGGGRSEDGATEFMSAESVNVRIVERVADREGVSPDELDRPLYDVVDPDALATLVADAAGQGLRVSFTYIGYDVTVTDDGDVDVVDATVEAGESRQGIAAAGEDGLE